MRGKTNRKKGFSAELYYKNIFEELGFEHCVTARFGSRISDNAKIDLINLPFNIQIKAGVQKGLNPCRELFNMGEKIREYFPPLDAVHDKPKILIHKKQSGNGKRYNVELVYMSYTQFETFKEKECDIVDDVVKIRKNRSKEDLGEFNVLVSINFKVFIEKIVKKLYLC